MTPEFNGLVEHEYREDVTPAEWKANWDNVQQAITWFFDSRWPDTEIMWEPPIPSEQKQIDDAVADAEKADIAIVVVGDQPRGIPNVRSTVGENSSRTGISLTGHQDDLIRAVVLSESFAKN